MKKQQKIVFVIAIAFTCVAVIPTFFWAIFNYQKTEKSIYKEQQATTEYIVKGIDKNIDIYFSEIKKITDSIFGSEIVQNILSEMDTSELPDLPITQYQRLQAFNAELMGGRADFIRTVLYSGDNEIYTNSTISFADISKSDQDEAVILNENGSKFVICGSRYYEYVNGKKYYVLTVGRKIRSLKNGKELGYLLIDIDYKTLEKIVGFNEKTEKDLLLIYHPDGEIIFSTASDQDIQKSYQKAESYRSALDKRGSEFQFDSMYFNWKYDIIRNNQKILSGLKETRNQLVAISAGVCILILMASVLIAYSLTRPIHKLENIMKKADLENYTEEIHIRTPYYEVTHLIHCYNRMIQRICQLVEEQKKLIRKQATVEYQALQMQITPHFLYNSLDSINCLAEIENQPEISKMIRGLARIFQYNMRFDTENVTLEDELTHVKNYCMLQAVNYQDRFDISYHIPDEIQHRKVVKFMLQPVVENAISHGMKGKKSGGHIEITAKDKEGIMEISVRDNGNGMSYEEADRLRQELYDGKEFENTIEGSNRIALKNVNRRLKYQYGDNAGIQFETEEGKGTVVFIHIPIL